MKHRIYYPVFVIMAFTFIACGANAETNPSGYLNFAVGHLGVFDSGIKEPEVLKIEYRFAKKLKWNLLPVLGAGRSANDASFVFVAIEREFLLTNSWIFSPSFGLGTFNDGKDVKLGNEFEFRTGIKLSYRLKNDIRLGLALYHLSNGGLSDRNPGTEPAFLSVSVPF